ncbi:DUF1439 domain-containing protein [Pseudoxanthomonas sangjuensis]|uniref:DUF1439 domain-containing protein n=1 Tax=Pseudoxanthomonas sangjuensis TaxID=1503750 RepID=UPI001391D863|nr:DUF1439 domain-containing protein [Pseudoxanthomonas sangjuensis]KAF1711025.1 DUF1439 domain-containing protein [Pseudoxanthomonas sangjuensis]
MNPRRRLLIASVAIVPFALAGCAGLDTMAALLGNQFSLSQMQIQQSLNGNFPKRYDKLGGLISLSLMNPRLSIPADSHRMRVDFDLGIGTFGGGSKPNGHFALSSGVRFDARTLGIHLDQPAIESVDVPALGGAMNSTVRGALNAWLADYSRDEPIYEFDNTLLGRIGSRRVGSTEIANGQVVVKLQ